MSRSRQSDDPLALFDLDGTLTATTAVDSECFVRAFAEELGCAVDDDWAGYEHTTDEGIAREALARHFGRPATTDEIMRVRRKFVGLLTAACEGDPGAVAEVSGAKALLAELARRGWAVAIATGAWSESAAIKRRAAGIPQSIPLVSCDDRPARGEILRAAIAAARTARGGEDFARVVSIGDGVWDVRAAARLGLPFLGVGTGDQAERLRAAGARVVVPDLSDLESVLALLARAGVPASARDR